LPGWRTRPGSASTPPPNLQRLQGPQLVRRNSSPSRPAGSSARGGRDGQPLATSCGGEGRGFGACCFAGKLRSPVPPDATMARAPQPIREFLRCSLRAPLAYPLAGRKRCSPGHAPWGEWSGRGEWCASHDRCIGPAAPWGGGSSPRRLRRQFQAARITISRGGQHRASSATSAEFSPIMPGRRANSAEPLMTADRRPDRSKCVLGRSGRTCYGLNDSCSWPPPPEEDQCDQMTLPPRP
jgi:hypothetical protein